MTPGPERLESAWADARRAEEHGGVEVRALTTLAELDGARAVWDAVWPTVPGATEVTGNLIRAIEHAGGYVSGAYAEGRVVGSCLGFLGRVREDGGWHTHLHSHIAAATPGNADRGIGTALKLHQRAWALQHGIDRVVWTFDPLVRRNARLNLVKLGAVGAEYLVDFYGRMDDSLNAGEPSDRLLAQWDVASDRVAAALGGGLVPVSRTDLLATGAEDSLVVAQDGEPRVVPASARTTLVALPGDIIDIRRRDGGLARAWRLAVREALAPVAAGDAQVVGLTTDGCFVVEGNA